MHYKQLTAIIHKEDDIYVSLCPELDIASQGENIEEAKGNLKEAVELFFECASAEEIKQHYETYLSNGDKVTESDALVEVMTQFEQIFGKFENVLENYALVEFIGSDESEALSIEGAKKYYASLRKA